jgi:hypothetical protein
MAKRPDNAARNHRHGHASRGRMSSEYQSWKGMKARCYQTTHIAYRYYGGRGIMVCAKWRDSFAAFLADMGPKPSSRHTLDRKDANGDYTPNNCRWATPRQQRVNQRPQDDSARVAKSWATGKRSRIGRERADMAGKKYGRLTVLSYHSTIDKRARWLCHCECGNQKVVTGKLLRIGSTKSCGCGRYAGIRQAAKQRTPDEQRARAIKG